MPPLPVNNLTIAGQQTRIYYCCTSQAAKQNAHKEKLTELKVQLLCVCTRYSDNGTQVVVDDDDDDDDTRAIIS